MQANIAKPLTLTWVQNLDLGTIVLGPGTWSNATVAISRAGLFSCANANVTCTGAAMVAKYNVSGTNNQTVRISTPNVTLTNMGDPTKTLDPGRRWPRLTRPHQFGPARAPISRSAGRSC